MPSPTLITFGSDLAIAGTYAVYVKQHWSDSWGTANPKILVDNVTWSANPSVPTATLRYEYGPTLENGASSPAPRSKLSIEGYWVKIVVDCPEGTRDWVGYVDAVGDFERGKVLYGVTYYAKGRQSFSCVGVVNVLQYVSMEQSFVEQHNAGFGIVVRSLSSCVFNDIDGDIERADKTRIDRMLRTRQTAKIEGQNSFAHVFDKIYGLNSNGTIEYEPWSTRDIAEHLVDRYSPVDSDGEQTIIFKWSTGSLDRLPDDDTPYLDTHDKSLLDCLNELLSAAKLFGYFATVNGSNEVELTTFTYADADVTTDDYTIPANANQVNLAMLADPATTYTVQTNLSSMYNRIRVRGDYRRTILTAKCNVSALPLASGNLNPGWDSSILARRAGKETAIDADTALTYAQNVEKTLALYDSPEFLPVYGAWILKTNQSTGIIKVGDEKIFEDQDELPYYPFPKNLIITPQLPLLKGLDYTAGFDQSAKAVSPREWMEMQVFTPAYTMNDTSGGAAPAMTAHETNKMYWGGRNKRTYYWTPTEPPFAIHAKPLENAVGVQLMVDGASQYQLIDGTSKPASTKVPHLPAINVNDISVTLCVRDDRRVEKIWPETTTGLDAVRELVINVPNLQKIRILANTLLYTANQVYTVDTTTDVRDDSTKILSIAKRAAAWFTVPRRIVRISSKRTTKLIDIGYLVHTVEPTTVQELAAKTVVTQLSISFGGRSPTMEIETQSGQLDPMAFTPPEWRTQ